MHKFVDYLKSKHTKPDKHYLTAEEFKRADTQLKRAQIDSFNSDILALIFRKKISCRSKLKSLQPIKKNELIVVDRRLRNDIPRSQKEPIILACDHKITKMIFVHVHSELLHCGPQSLLAQVRHRYWPIKGRDYSIYDSSLNLSLVYLMYQG